MAYPNLLRIMSLQKTLIVKMSFGPFFCVATTVLPQRSCHNRNLPARSTTKTTELHRLGIAFILAKSTPAKLIAHHFDSAHALR